MVSIARNMGKVIGILPDPDTLSLFDDLVEIARDLPDSWVEKHPLALASIAEQMAGLCQTEWADLFEDTIEEAMDAFESVEGSLKLARAISNLSRPLEGIAGENPEKTYDILRRMLECAKNITGDGEVSEAFAAIGHAMRGLAKHEKPISQDMLKEWVGLLSGIDHVWDWEHTIPVMHIRSGLVDLLRIAPNQGAELLLPALWSKDEDVRRAREAKSICDIALNAKKLEPNRDDGCELFKSAMAATERIKGHLSAVRVCADSFVSAASICQECGRMAVKHALERARAEKADWARADSFQRISKVLVKIASLPGNSEVLKEVITDELACFEEDRKRQHGMSEGEVSWMDWDHSERLQALAEPISTLAESDPDWAFEKAMQALNIVSNMDDPSRAAGALAAYAPVAASIAKKRQGLGQKLFDKLLELIRLKEGDSKKGLILSEAGTAVAVGLWTFDLVRAERLIEDVVNSVREIEDNWSVGKAVCNISSSLRTWAELDQEHAQEVLCRMMEKAKDAGDHRMLDKLNGMELMSGYREPPEQETWPAEIEEAIQNINSCPHGDQRPEWIARLAEWVQEVVEEGDRLFKVMRRLDTKVRHLLLMSTPCLDVGTWSLALSLQLLATVMSERNCNAILDGMRMEGLLE
ncbi:hypothetical protein D6779_02620 [Candidatus Parcubacteria bacterium]|nr:MAG: hypothetical protein D6779_02620 [Candidatus Parcubacteria bacterium]